MRATSVGPDLSRAIVRIEKPGYTGPDAEPAPAAADTGEEPAAEEDAVASGDGDDASPLSLSA
jgi:single-strand DNA-binding protein